MNEAARARLFGYEHAFDHPLTEWIVVALVVLLVAAPLVIVAVRFAKRLSASQYQELMHRYWTWLALVPLLIWPILAGAFWTIVAVGFLGLLCYFEFAGNTPLRNERLINVLVLLGIVLLTFASLDHWFGFYAALFPLTIGMIAALSILPDRPNGYLQRVALGVLGFALFGSALSHLGYLANDTDYRPLVLLILLCVELNDVFAYLCGKSFGRRKLAPNTSPNKTIGGSLGALILTTALFAGLGHFVFALTPLAWPGHLLAMGAMVSILGQLGDLLISSIKRDLGIKDMGSILPGHGGLLDRFDSLLLVAPAMFHYVNYFQGIGLDQPTRVFTGA